ncbi:unnamed protein product [Timema podura]|uniref:Uncharacterized protein n=1 Tax=Timema podura TaxID=61482 RepID=A0ABN7P7N5_TIMPD|nr:unnamed protein product [Timema podura]
MKQGVQEKIYGIQNERGEMIWDENSRRERWKEYFEQLYGTTGAPRNFLWKGLAIPFEYKESVTGARKFVSGVGKHGEFKNISDEAPPVKVK